MTCYLSTIDLKKIIMAKEKKRRRYGAIGAPEIHRKAEELNKRLKDADKTPEQEKEGDTRTSQKGTE